MRGFGDSTFISKSHLHGGNYRDAISVIEFVHRMSPLSKISLVGFSVGGNVILKTLGYWGERPHSSVDSAITISPPIDLVHCSWNLRQQGNRLYELYFVKRMKAQLTARRKHVKDLVDNQMSPFPNRLIHWDDQFTAPCWGYRGAKEYYEDASSAQDLGQIKVPTVILTSRDDPVVPVSIYDECHMSDCIEFVATQKGGHLGFYSQGGRDPDRFWLDWRICQWVLSQDESSLPETPRGPVRRRGSARSLNRLSSGQRR